MRSILKNIPVLFLLASCASPKISNLEKGRYTFNENATSNTIEVSVSRLPIAVEESVQPKPITFLDMRDSLPHLYMNLLSSKISNADTFIIRLSKPILPTSKNQGEKKQTNYTEYRVQFVFNNLKKYYNDERLMHPNTRLEFLTTYLSLPVGSAATFYNINKLQNEFEEIDLGTLSRDQTVSLNAKLNVSGGLGGGYENNSSNKAISINNRENSTGNNVYDADGNLIGTINYKGIITSTNEGNTSNKSTAEAKINAALEGAYQNSETIKEAIAVQLKRLRTGFNFSERNLVIAQRGRLSGDISDNIYVTATLKVSNSNNVFTLPVYSFEKLYNENNQPNIADKLLFSKREVNFVPCDNAADITFTTKYEGAIRSVRNLWLNAGTNALEYDDKVTFYRIGTTTGAPLTIDKSEYCKNAYKFIATDASGARYILKIADPSHRELDVFIDDYPQLLWQWLIDNLSNPIAGNLNTTRFILYFEKIDLTKQQIPIVKQNMTPTDIATLRTITGITIEKRNP
jgi:hypothetical protein